MTVKELAAQLKIGAPCGVYLLFGEEAFLKTHYLRLITEQFSGSPFDELNVFRFEGKEYSTDVVENAIEGPPVMAEHKLLVFSGSLVFKPDGRTGAKQEYRDYWEKRLRDIPEYCHVVFFEDDVDKRSALYKFVNKHFAACEFAYLSENEMTNWTVKLFKTMGKSLSAFDAQHLVGICDAGMHSVKREAEKLAAYTGSRLEVTRADIDAVVTPSVKSKAFDMVDAMLAGNADKALRLLGDLFTLREPELKILGAINYQLDKLLAVKLLAASGADKSTITSRLKLVPFLAGKYLKQAQAYPLERLGRMIEAANETDVAMKSNSIDNHILLEMLVARNCA